jgi:hypothetical protein
LTQFRGLFGYGDDKNAFGRNQSVEAADGGLEQALVADEWDGLFGPVTPRDGPKPCPAAASHDDCIKMVV